MFEKHGCEWEGINQVHRQNLDLSRNVKYMIGLIHSHWGETVILAHLAPGFNVLHSNPEFTA
jgi:hypothetical protein